MLVFESIRNRRVECHIASHVIPADDSHALPLFTEFLQSPQLQPVCLSGAKASPVTCKSTKASNDDVKIWRDGASDSLPLRHKSCPGTAASDLEAASSMCIVSRQKYSFDASSSQASNTGAGAAHCQPSHIFDQRVRRKSEDAQCCRLRVCTLLLLMFLEISTGRSPSRRNDIVFSFCRSRMGPCSPDPFFRVCDVSTPRPCLCPQNHSIGVVALRTSYPMRWSLAIPLAVAGPPGHMRLSVPPVGGVTSTPWQLQRNGDRDGGVRWIDTREWVERISQNGLSQKKKKILKAKCNLTSACASSAIAALPSSMTPSGHPHISAAFLNTPLPEVYLHPHPAPLESTFSLIPRNRHAQHPEQKEQKNNSVVPLTFSRMPIVSKEEYPEKKMSSEDMMHYSRKFKRSRITSPPGVSTQA